MFQDCLKMIALRWCWSVRVWNMRRWHWLWLIINVNMLLGWFQWVFDWMIVNYLFLLVLLLVPFLSLKWIPNKVLQVKALALIDIQRTDLLELNKLWHSAILGSEISRQHKIF